MSLKNILRELLVANPPPADSFANPPRRFLESLRSFYTLSSILGETLTKNKNKMESPRLSCQSFSKILRISGKICPEMHIKFK
jgi:hypothetical protein